MSLWRAFWSRNYFNNSHSHNITRAQESYWFADGEKLQHCRIELSLANCGLNSSYENWSVVLVSRVEWLPNFGRNFQGTFCDFFLWSEPITRINNAEVGREEWSWAGMECRALVTDIGALGTRFNNNSDLIFVGVPATFNLSWAVTIWIVVQISIIHVKPSRHLR